MYQEVETMTAEEFHSWWIRLNISEKFAYHAFIFKHLAEGKAIEITRGKGWVEFHPEYEPDVINRHCRIKPQPKELKYKPYETADPKWLGKALRNIKTGNIFLINGITQSIVWFLDSWHYVNLMLDYYEWYDLNTGETTPFGEAYYE